MRLSSALVQAHDLCAVARQGTIFGPLDLDLFPDDLCIVHGDRGSGKSAFLLALAGRFHPLAGDLTINGIDAIHDPYRAIEHTTVARLGNYVAPEDRLTLDESISERAYLDGLSISEAHRRARQIEDYLGFRMDRAVEIEQFDPVSRVLISVGLAMLRPASVIVVDDVDMVVPHSRQRQMFEALAKLARFDHSVIVCAAIDADTAPQGCVRVRLASRHQSHVMRNDESQIQVEIVENPPVLSVDPDAGKDRSQVIVERVGADRVRVVDNREEGR